MMRQGGHPVQTARWLYLVALPPPLASIVSPAAAQATDHGTAALAPMTYLIGFGPKTNPVVPLTWAMLAISVAVVAIVTGLVVFGVLIEARPDF